MFPHLKIVARARNRQHAFRLMDLNVDDVVRETLHSSLEMARLLWRNSASSQRPQPSAWRPSASMTRSC
jgi:glutathione-regulated potassium-efflux system protein KefB